MHIYTHTQLFRFFFHVEQDNFLSYLDYLSPHYLRKKKGKRKYLISH